MKCCGVESWKDWSERNPNYGPISPDPYAPQDRPDYPTQLVPESCCDPNLSKVITTYHSYKPRFNTQLQLYLIIRIIYKQIELFLGPMWTHFEQGNILRWLLSKNGGRNWKEFKNSRRCCYWNCRCYGMYKEHVGNRYVYYLVMIIERDSCVSIICVASTNDTRDWICIGMWKD